MPAVNLITAIPAFISPEEHKSILGSTPASFKDIPPVLRYREENVSITLDPPLESFTAEDAAHGSLYVITSALVYMSTTGRGFQIEYPAITLHAVSRGELGPSIYCQLDENAGDPTAEDEDVTEMRELTIVPQNTSSLEPIFEALSQCASLHPDKESASDEEEGLDDAFIESVDVDGLSRFETFTGDEDQELSEVGRVALAHLESIIYDPYDSVPPQPNGVDLALAASNGEPTDTAGEQQTRER